MAARMNVNEAVRNTNEDSPAGTSRKGSATAAFSDLGSDWSVAGDTSDGDSSLNSFEIIETESAATEGSQGTHQKSKNEPCAPSADSEGMSPISESSTDGEVEIRDAIRCLSISGRGTEHGPFADLLDRRTDDIRVPALMSHEVEAVSRTGTTPNASAEAMVFETPSTDRQMPRWASLQKGDVEIHAFDVCRSASESSSHSSELDEDEDSDPETEKTDFDENTSSGEESDFDEDSDLDEDTDLDEETAVQEESEDDTDFDEETAVEEESEDFDEDSEFDEDTDFDEDTEFDEDTDFDEYSDFDEEIESDEASSSDEESLSGDGDSAEEEYHSSNERSGQTSPWLQDQESWAKLMADVDSLGEALDEQARLENLFGRLCVEGSGKNSAVETSAAVEDGACANVAWGYSAKPPAATSQGHGLCASPEASDARSLVDSIQHRAAPTDFSVGGLGGASTYTTQQYGATSFASAQPQARAEEPVNLTVSSQLGDCLRAAASSVSSPSSDRVHADLSLKDSIPSLGCPVCLCTFTIQERLDQHLGQHAERTPYACARCLVATSGEQQMYHHLRSHLAESQLSCQFCRLSFATRSQLFQHRVKQTCLAPILAGENQTARKYCQVPSMYSCARCPQMFSSAVDMEIHQGWHDGYLVHVCFGCEKAFHSPTEFLEHQREHLERDIYRCPGCDARFPYRDDLTKHAETYGAMERLAESLSNRYRMQTSHYFDYY